MFRKMRAAFGPRAAAPRRLESLFPPRCFAGILSVALVLLLPSLTDADCDDPPRYESMKPKGGQPSPPYNHGYQIEYECRLGYRRIPPFHPLSAVCHPNNTWTTLREACTRRLCPQLGEPQNGRFSGSFEFGSELHYTCDQGYYLLGPDTISCVIAGDGNSVEWSADPPNCEKILCKPPKKIQNGQYSYSHKEVFEYNEVVVYSCIRSGGPDEFSLIGNSELFCTGHDKWSSDPPECKVVRCPNPVPKDGYMASGFDKKYSYKAQVVLACNKGFSLEGSSVVVCEANSTWEPKTPTCVKVLTPSPSTKLPSLTHSVSPPSTELPISSVSGGPPPSDETPSGKLGPGPIAAISIVVVGVLVAVLVGALFYHKKKKKGKSELPAQYSPGWSKSSTPAEPAL
ncbi:PREDICTED: membrane cofactor protein isoform X3 [Miniopterus natalensis]|uniref:membrane cofactor protein isoform X3 n=1 Tax=Miniopterus natalensis TaxID=291302 RepID=UPI0007A6EAEF|nr:PREDICTED: membrane cofactor protein isoform X3 [Miniopterus natalensis]